MYRTQYVLALLALYVGLTHSFSWDFATASGSQLEFYLNGRHTHSENFTSGDIWLIAYDAVGNRMVCINSYGSAIISYDLTTKKIKSFELKTDKKKFIQHIAFDPVEEKLFWTKLTSEIYWFSLKPGFANNDYGNILILLPNWGKILALDVDSCRRYIYWTSINLDEKKCCPYTIERARFDGSERKVLIYGDFQPPLNLAVDQQTKKLYWIHDTRFRGSYDDQQFFIESADLNGKNRTILYNETGNYQANTLAVSKDYIYSAHNFPTTVYQSLKNPSIHAKPKEISTTRKYTVLVTNYKIADQIRGNQDCEGLKRLIPNNSATDDNVSLNISSEVSLVCVHGMKVSGKSQCECTHGYTGERCDVSVCQNYCFQGDCIVTAEGQPTCRCKAGYSEERCEVEVCRGYCLNDGICSLNEESEPVCQCPRYYEGKRCDVSTCLNKCFQKVVSKVWGIIINTDVSQATLDEEVKSTCATTAV